MFSTITSCRTNLGVLRTTVTKLATTPTWFHYLFPSAYKEAKLDLCMSRKSKKIEIIPLIPDSHFRIEKTVLLGIDILHYWGDPILYVDRFIFRLVCLFHRTNSPPGYQEIPRQQHSYERMEPEVSILSPGQTPNRLGQQQCRHSFFSKYIQVDIYHAQGDSRTGLRHQIYGNKIGGPRSEGAREARLAGLNRSTSHGRHFAGYSATAAGPKKPQSTRELQDYWLYQQMQYVWMDWMEYMYGESGLPGMGGVHLSRVASNPSPTYIGTWGRVEVIKYLESLHSTHLRRFSSVTTAIQGIVTISKTFTPSGVSNQAEINTKREPCPTCWYNYNTR